MEWVALSGQELMKMKMMLVGQNQSRGVIWVGWFVSVLVGFRD
jgi:hypothetical protein